MCNHIIKSRASDLPDEWDKLAKDNIYLYRSFLSFIEKTEKDYKPEYHLIFKEGKLDSYFIAFRVKRYNLAMFTKFNFKISITMIYLPMCVTRGGFVFGDKIQDALSAIKKIKGYKMILNLEDCKEFSDFATGKTCPKCILNLRAKSFDEYLNSLRSDYRNRYKKVLAKTEDVTFRFIDNKTEFTKNLYSFYLNVLNKSRVRIETLSKEYFEGDVFKVFVAEYEGKSIGFVQLLENGTELIFEFVGVDYTYNDKFPLYHRMLLEIIRYGAEKGFKTIDFGQTADEIKLKLGCDYVPLYAALHHSFKPLNWVCKKLARYIEYRPVETKYRVFK